ncbi:MAG TPA: hypothetical protein VFB00_10340 [Terriglobales bacterium]|nr:hypothetical protein [Terriglobales bacterium]
MQAKKCFLLVWIPAVCAALAANKPAAPVLRWSEGAPNCSLREDDDGRNYYGITSGDIEITLAVDRQELGKSARRALPAISALLSFQYKGNDQFEVRQNRFSLEFVKHARVVQSSLDPDGILTRLQQNAQDLTDEVERHQVRKHPEQKEKLEAELAERIKDYDEMTAFIETRALRPTVLNAGKRSVSGWVFFNTRNRWIGPWRRPEEFVLRIPLENLVVEFPFQLPPKTTKVQLRRRQQ